jgi:hypothetical protein
LRATAQAVGKRYLYLAGYDEGCLQARFSGKSLGDEPDASGKKAENDGHGGDKNRNLLLP